MKAYYTLIDTIDVPMSVQLMNRSKNGNAIWKMYRRVPGEKYEITDEQLNDKDFMHVIRTRTITKPYSEALENTLKQNDIEFKLKRCNSCGGKKTTITYNSLKVVIPDENRE